MLTNPSLNGSAHVKLYLKNTADEILIFEFAVPSSLIALSINAPTFSEAETTFDLLWFTNYAYPQNITEEDTSVKSAQYAVSQAAPGTWTLWTGPKTYKTSYYVGGELAQCMSIPYVSYCYANVASGATGSSDWTASFKVSESVTIAGKVYYGCSPFYYTDLSLTFGCGAQTKIMKVNREGRFIDIATGGNRLQQVGSSIGVALLKRVGALIPGGTAYATICGYLSSLTSVSSTVTLGTETSNLSSNLITFWGEKLNNYKRFSDFSDFSSLTPAGDFYTLNVSVSSSGSAKLNTSGVLQIKFKACSEETGILQTFDQKIQLNYSLK